MWCRTLLLDQKQWLSFLQPASGQLLIHFDKCLVYGEQWQIWQYWRNSWIKSHCVLYSLESDTGTTRGRKSLFKEWPWSFKRIHSMIQKKFGCCCSVRSYLINWLHSWQSYWVVKSVIQLSLLALLLYFIYLYKKLRKNFWLVLHVCIFSWFVVQSALLDCIKTAFANKPGSLITTVQFPPLLLLSLSSD